MAKLNGTKLVLYIKVGTGDYQALLAATSHNINIDVDLPDATTKGSAGWAEHIEGLRSLDGSVDGLHDPTESFSREEILDLIENRTGCKIKSSTEETGSKYWEFDASLSNFTETADQEQPVTFSCSFRANGKPELKTVTS